MAIAPNRVAGNPAKFPKKPPIGVRLAEMI
jgi:hypothetical protein